MDNRFKMDIQKIEKFLRNSAYSPQTIIQYRWHLRRIGAFLTVLEKDWFDLDPELITRFMQRQAWGDNMRAQSLQSARAMVGFYYGNDHPLFELPVRKPKPKPQRTLNEAEVRNLFRSLDRNRPHGIRNYAMVAVMLDTGIRATEVCNFELKHLDMEDRSFRIRTKGGSFRTKVFSDYTAEYLRNWLEIRSRHALPGVDTVFVGIGGNLPGTEMTTSGLRNIFKRIGKKANIRGLSPHVLRRTFATLSTIYGAPAVVLQKAGGWSDIKTMSIYTQAVPTRTIEQYLVTTHIAEQERGIKLDEEGGRGEDSIFDWA